MTDINTLLAERGNTHGDFTVHAAVTQGIKDLMRKAPSYPSLSPIQIEAMEMIAHKLGRIAAGNPHHRDHWDDIAGYARLVSDRLPLNPPAQPPKG